MQAYHVLIDLSSDDALTIRLGLSLVESNLSDSPTLVKSCNLSACRVGLDLLALV